MDNNSLTHKTLKNVSYRFVAYLWPMIFTIFITPIIVFRLGVKDYGIYIFITAATGMLSLLDLGVSTAVIKYLAEYSGRGDIPKMRRLIYSANTLFLLIGLAGFAITVFISLAGSWLFPDRIINEQYYLVLFILAGLNFFIASTNAIYNLIPDALGRFDLSSKISIVYLTAVSLANLIVVLLGYKLIAIFLTQLIATICFFFVRRYFAVKILPIARYHLAWYGEEIKNCYRFGIATVINNTANTSLAYLDRLTIPIFINPASLTYYSLPGNVAARIPGVTDNLVGIIFPVTASLAGAGDHDRIKRFYVRSVRLITLIAAAISLSIIFLAYPILKYWLSADFAVQSTGILIILVLTNFVIAILSPVSGFFIGLGKLKFSSILSAVMAVLNAALLFFFLPRWGITGAAWAYLLSVLPIFYMIYFIEQKYLNLAGRGKYYIKAVIQLATSALIFFVIVKFLIAPLIVSLATLIVLGPLTVLLYLALYLVLGFFEPEDLTDLKKFARSISQKLLGRKKSDES